MAAIRLFQITVIFLVASKGLEAFPQAQLNLNGTIGSTQQPNATEVTGGSSSEESDESEGVAGRAIQIGKKIKKSKKKVGKNDEEGKIDAGRKDGQCGLTRKLVDKITNGEEVNIADRPWQVGLVIKNSPGAFCGGSLISLQHVLTAAHCMYGDEGFISLSKIQIVAGTDNISKPKQIRNVKFRSIHGQYNDKKENDIALLVVNQPFKPSDQVTPICLPSPKTKYVSGLNCVITGWGNVDESAPNGEVKLRSASVDVLDNKECKIIYREYGTFSRNMFCGGDTQKGKGTCYGDSGGPFACKQKGVFYLYGITSWGVECDSHEFPAVYTRVAAYLDWINERTSARKKRATYDEDESEDEEDETEVDNEANESESDDEGVEDDEVVSGADESNESRGIGDGDDDGNENDDDDANGDGDEDDDGEDGVNGDGGDDEGDDNGDDGDGRDDEGDDNGDDDEEDDNGDGEDGDGEDDEDFEGEEDEDNDDDNDEYNEV